MLKNTGIGLRIKEIRKKTSDNQADCAKKLNISASALSQIENESTLPSLELLNLFVKEYLCDFFWLVNGTELVRENGKGIGKGSDDCYPILSPKLSPNQYPEQNYNPSIVQEPQELYTSKSLHKELKRLKDIEDEYVINNNIIYIPYPARAGFLEGFGDEKYEATLPRFSLPALNKGIYYAFSVSGDSMYSTFTNGDVVITKHVENLGEIRPKEPYVISTVSEGLVLKRLRITKEGNKIEFLSDNSFYEPYTVPKSDIKAIFRVIRFLSDNTGARNVFEDHVNDMVERMKSLEVQIKALKGL